ncbi:MAG: hypothetical protein N3B10_05245 [Armatimonadetes bacterium]|nr:hypothetical protein [Armatimonadota bacterium]MCX7967880.1 hypothetical protein [Armatimonadota bacterium]MDW8142308.1 hypothetical protein [Armatimonadota bacterium]
MEMAIFVFGDLVAKSKSPIAVLFWMALVGVLIWLPSLLNFVSRYRCGQFIAHFVSALGLIPIFQLAVAPFMQLILSSTNLDSYWRSSTYTLHLLALCFLSIWLWLQTLQTRQKGSRENASEVMLDLVRQDLIMVTRLALWLTLSLMPTIKWS